MDRLKEECGVFGIFNNKDAAALTALGLHALQHRGQEACGIVTFDEKKFYAERRLGLVGDNFTKDKVIGYLPGSCDIGHNRYSTAGNNLLKNAVESVYKIKNPFITVKLDVEKEYLRLHIIDNGVGIDKSIITKIFQPYFTTKEKGTGLGLSICKKIIEDHGGNISIKKNTSTGSTVTLSLLL